MVGTPYYTCLFFLFHQNLGCVTEKVTYTLQSGVWLSLLMSGMVKSMFQRCEMGN